MKITGLLLLSTILSSGYLGASDGAVTDVPAVTEQSLDAVEAKKVALQSELQRLAATAAEETGKGRQLKADIESSTQKLALLKQQQENQAESLLNVLGGKLQEKDTKPLACPAFQRIMDRNLLARSTPAIKGEESIRLMQNPTRTENLFMNIGLKFGAFKVNTLPSISFLQNGMEDLLKDLRNLVKELSNLNKQLAKKGSSLKAEKNEAALKLINEILETKKQFTDAISVITAINAGSVPSLSFDKIDLGDFPRYLKLELQSGTALPTREEFRTRVNGEIVKINTMIKELEGILYKPKKGQKVRQKEIAPIDNTAVHIYSLLKQGHIVFKGKTNAGKLTVEILKPFSEYESLGSSVSTKPSSTVVSAPVSTNTFETVALQKQKLIVELTDKLRPPSVSTSLGGSGTRTDPTLLYKDILNLIKRYKALDQLDDLGVDDFDDTERYYVLIKPDAELYSKKVDLEEFINAVMFKQKPKPLAKQPVYVIADDLYTGKKVMQWHMSKKISSSVKNMLTFCKQRDSRICGEKETELVQSIHRCEHKYLPRCFKGAYNNPLVTSIAENIYKVLEQKWKDESLVKGSLISNRRSSLPTATIIEIEDQEDASATLQPMLSKDEFLDNSRLRKNILAYIRLTELTNRETSWDGRMLNSTMLRKNLEMMMQDIALVVNDMSDLQGSDNIKDLAKEVLKNLLSLDEEQRDSLATEHGKTLQGKQAALAEEKALNVALSSFLTSKKREMKGYRYRPFSH